MKIRTGFVSNSSSTSFIVGFDKKPKTIGQLLDLMFPDYHISSTISYYDTYTSKTEVVERVWKDMGKQLTSKAVEVFIDEYADHFAYGDVSHSYPEKTEIYDKLREKYGDGYYKTEEYREAIGKLEEKEDKMVEERKPKYKEEAHRILDGKKCFFFEYHDNVGEGESLLEHGNIFRNLPHIAINNH
jgi:hypothetical protein